MEPIPTMLHPERNVPALGLAAISQQFKMEFDRKKGKEIAIGNINPMRNMFFKKK